MGVIGFSGYWVGRAICSCDMVFTNIVFLSTILPLSPVRSMPSVLMRLKMTISFMQGGPSLARVESRSLQPTGFVPLMPDGA